MDIKRFDVNAGDEFGNPNTIEDDREMEQEYEQGDAEWEDVPSVCPDCGHGGMKKIMYADGPDDYHWHYECMGCGSTWD